MYLPIYVPTVVRTFEFSATQVNSDADSGLYKNRIDHGRNRLHSLWAEPIVYYSGHEQPVAPKSRDNEAKIAKIHMT